MRIATLALLLAAGCAGARSTLPYAGPFQAGFRYVADGPVSVRLDDSPFEVGSRPAEGATSPTREFRETAVLLPGTRLEFARRDHHYLVFRVISGEHGGRYAWVNQYSEEDVKRLSALPREEPSESPPTPRQEN